VTAGVRPPVAPRDFVAGMRLLPHGVTVVTTDGPAGRSGATVSAVCSVSAEPPTLLVCLNSAGRTAVAVRRNGSFVVNVLGPQHRRLSDAFAGMHPGTEDRFRHAGWAALASGSPVLSDAPVAFDCAVTDILRRGTHDVMFGQVLALQAPGGSALAYRDCGYRRLEPLGDGAPPDAG